MVGRPVASENRTVPVPNVPVLACCVARRLNGIIVADRLLISEETVKVHVKHIMDKPGANDRSQAIAIAVRRSIIPAK